MKQEGEVYLGDGLYARIEGGMIILRAPRINGDHWVGLEPEVWNALLDWLKSQPGVDWRVRRERTSSQDG